MTVGINGATVPLQGVVTMAPSSIHLDIREQVAKSLAGVPDGKTMAVVNVTTKAGVNLAIAHKFNDHWMVDLYVGKSGWQSPVEGGATVAFSR